MIPTTMAQLATWIHSGQLVTLVMAALHFTHLPGWRGVLVAMGWTTLCLLPWYVVPVWVFPALTEHGHVAGWDAVREALYSAVPGVCIAWLLRAVLRRFGVEMGKM